MSKKSIKMIIICLVAILTVALVANKVFASSGNITDMLTNSNESTIPGNSADGNIPEGTVQNQNQNQNQNLNTLNNVENKNANAPTTTPYTGIGDYSVYIFIGIFAVSTIFAYKKIREYNV